MRTVKIAYPFLRVVPTRGMERRSHEAGLRLIELGVSRKDAENFDLFGTGL